jgi:hypothetical protein
MSKEDRKGLLSNIETEDRKNYRLRALFAVGPYYVILLMAIVEDRLELVGLDLRSFPGRSGVAPITTGGTLRRLPLAEMVDTAARQMQEAQRADRTIAFFAGPPLHKAAGRRPREFYELIAELYDDAVRAGLPPSRRVFEQLNEIGLATNRATTRKHIERARELGLLPKTEKRRIAGNTGSKGRTQRG